MRHSLKILIIDPNENDVKTYQQYFNEGFESEIEFFVTKSAENAQEISEKELVDCILLEYALEGPNGISFLQAMGYEMNSSLPPVIMLTDSGSEAIAVQALKQGVSDYIVKKEMTKAALLIAVSDALEIREYTLKVRDRQRKMRRFAHVDSLTDLPNRHMFETIMELALARSQRYDRQFAVLLINLDNLNQINDIYGYDIGDSLIAELAVRFERCSRKSDTLANLGGNNFGIILEEINDKREATLVCERILEELEIPMKLRNHVIAPVISIGIAVYPDAGNTCMGLMRSADAAMYYARSKGENTYEFYTDELAVEELQRMTIESALPGALERGEFHLCYQPIIEMPTDRLIGMEALIRWTHPKRGLVSPSRFIPMAEKTGLIWPIGEWILQEVCSQVRRWHDAGLKDFYVTINLSACQLSYGELPRIVKHIIDKSGIPPESIKFELTETAVMTNPRVSEGYLRRLDDMGCKVILDDFGTGYSTLELLRFLPLSGLKIDASFIRDLGRKESDMKIVRSVLNLGQSLNLIVVAEGIEVEKQKEMLMLNRCKYGQGNLFSVPLKAADMTKFIQAKQGKQKN